MEQLDYNLLYRWFVGLAPDDPVWDPTTFTKNRIRLENGEVFAKFMAKLLNHPDVKPLLSSEHFSVDGTLIEAWASHKSFRPKDGSGDGDNGANFHGRKRKNESHASVTDPDSRLYRKAAGQGSEALLHGTRHHGEPQRSGGGRSGHACHGNGRAARLRRHAQSQGQGKPAAALRSARTRPTTPPITSPQLRALNVTPHVAQYNQRQSERTPERHRPDERPDIDGYGMSQSCRAHGRMHLRMGQAARNHAQDQTSRPRPRRWRLPAQPDRLQSRPHTQAGRRMMRQMHTDRHANNTQNTANGKLRAILPVFQQTASVSRSDTSRYSQLGSHSAPDNNPFACTCSARPKAIVAGCPKAIVAG